MYENEITIRGRVVAPPQTGTAQSGDPWASLRVASSSRVPAPGGGFQDGHTNFFTVKCWRALAANVAQSISKGEPVVVHGLLKVIEYERRDGSRGVDVAIEARAIGHDLSYGRTTFAKVYGFAPRVGEQRTSVAEAPERVLEQDTTVERVGVPEALAEPAGEGQRGGDEESVGGWAISRDDSASWATPGVAGAGASVPEDESHHGRGEGASTAA